MPVRVQTIDLSLVLNHVKRRSAHLDDAEMVRVVARQAVLVKHLAYDAGRRVAHRKEQRLVRHIRR